MPLPTRKIVGQAVYGDNTGASGRLRFTPEFIVAYDGVVVLPGPVTVIAGNGGTFEVDLATTDAAGYAPADWVWQVEELWPGGRTFLFELPTEDGSNLDYTNLIPATSIADPYAAHTHPELGGLPAGGTAGQIVVKQSSLTGDAEWENPADANIIVEGDARLTDAREPLQHGNEAHDFNYVDAAGAADAAPVQTVNTLTGDVVLNAESVGALPDDAVISDLTDVDTSGVTTDDLLTWNGNDWAPTSSPTVDLISFDTVAPGTPTNPGDLAWDPNDETLDLIMGGNVIQQIGQEQYVRARHASSAGITRGTVYYVSGATGGNKEVLPAQADDAATCKTTIGVAAQTVAGGEKAHITTFGMLKGLPDALFTNVTEGTVVYLSAATAGAFTSTPPTSPDHRVVVGFCVRKQSNNNELFIRTQTGLDVNELCDVEAPSPANRDLLVFNDSTGRWENDTLDATDVGAYPDTNPSNYIDAAGAPVQSVNTATGAVVLGAADVGAAPVRATLNAQTGTAYTLTLTDENSLVTLANAAAITVTVPAEASVSFPVGAKVDLAQTGAGQVTVAGDSGVTVQTSQTLLLRAQWSGASLIKLATDEWLLVGDLEAA